jgi:hypothetical protein
MNTIKINLLCFLLLNTFFANAAVKTLNNNNPSPGQYTTWAAVAITLVNNDTVYVSGSPFSYGDIHGSDFPSGIIPSNITIIGTGFNPNKQNPLISKFDLIEMVPNSATSLFHKINLIGLSINNGLVLSNVNEVHIQKCYVLYKLKLGITPMTPASPSVIEHNIFDLNTSSIVPFIECYTTNITLRASANNNLVFLNPANNMLLYGTNLSNSVIHNSDISYWLSQNNTLPSSIYNNIFIHCALTAFSSCQVSYNSFDANSSTNKDDGNNLLNSNPLFVSPPATYPFVFSLNQD